jgi:hypothetical protein
VKHKVTGSQRFCVYFAPLRASRSWARALSCSRQSRRPGTVRVTAEICDHSEKLADSGHGTVHGPHSGIPWMVGRSALEKDYNPVDGPCTTMCCPSHPPRKSWKSRKSRENEKSRKSRKMSQTPQKLTRTKSQDNFWVRSPLSASQPSVSARHGVDKMQVVNNPSV